MRGLVTGGHGFLGRHLVAGLTARYGATSVFAPSRSEIEAAEGGIAGLLQRHAPDHVWHLAGRLNGTERELRRDNDAAAAEWFEALLGCAPGPRVVLAGSAAVYGVGGSREAPVDERRTPAPRGLYAETKFAAELHARRFAADGGDMVIARISNPVGSGMGEHLLCGTIARQIVEIERGAQEAVLHLRDLSPMRDFIHASDVAEALIHLAMKGASGEAYNVAAGTSTSARTMAEMFLAEARVRPIEIRSTVQEASRSPMQEQWLDHRKLVGSGWRPSHTLTDAVRELLEARRANVPC